MKKMSIAIACIALAAVLALPANAFARPGRGAGSTRGHAYGMPAVTPSVVTTPGPAFVPHGKAKGLAKRLVPKPLRSRAASPDADPDDESGVPRARESSETSGIANALSRIQANIAKSQAKVTAGTKKRIPPGLLRVLAKFMAWLGLTPVAPAPVPPVAPVPPSTITSPPPTPSL